jgi:hypothetical protein
MGAPIGLDFLMLSCFFIWHLPCDHCGIASTAQGFNSAHKPTHQLQGRVASSGDERHLMTESSVQDCDLQDHLILVFVIFVCGAILKGSPPE